MIARLADAFGWDVPSDAEFMARAELRFGAPYALLTAADIAPLSVITHS